MAKVDKTMKIFDYMEQELPLYHPEDRLSLARDIIKFAAIFGVEISENPFAPLTVLDGIKEELSEEISGYITEEIGEECKKEAKKRTLRIS